MSMSAAFQVAGNSLLSVTQSSGDVALPKPNAPVTSLLNIGPNVLFWKAGVGAQTANASLDTALGANEQMFVSLGPSTHIAAICPSGGTANFYISQGAWGPS